MADPIIKELWEAKDAIAREHGNDLGTLVEYLRERGAGRHQAVVDLSKRPQSTSEDPATS